MSECLTESVCVRAPEFRADMLLVRGDPTTDILATRNISRVWKAGVEVDNIRSQ